MYGRAASFATAIMAMQSNKKIYLMLFSFHFKLWNFRENIGSSHPNKAHDTNTNPNVIH